MGGEEINGAEFCGWLVGGYAVSFSMAGNPVPIEP